MQVDQFESEVESLSVQTRKKKGDKEVSSSSVFFRLFLISHCESSSIFYQPNVFRVFSGRSKIVLRS